MTAAPCHHIKPTRCVPITAAQAKSLTCWQGSGATGAIRKGGAPQMFRAVRFASASAGFGPRSRRLEECSAAGEADAETAEEKKEAPSAVLTALATETARDPQLSIFTQLLAETKLPATAGEGPVTVFAPTNVAFERFFEERRLSVEQTLEFEGLSEIMTYHMLEGAMAYKEFKNDTKITPIQGSPLTATISGYAELKVNDASVSEPGTVAENVVLPIDEVLLPPYTIWTKVIEPKEILSLEGWAPEVINGRVAMIGILAAFLGELNTGDAFTAQMFEHFGDFLRSALIISAASFAPSFQNRSGYVADPKMLKTNSSWQAAIQGGFIPGFVEPYFTPEAEMLNGRVAMGAILAMILIETIKGSAIL